MADSHAARPQRVVYDEDRLAARRTRKLVTPEGAYIHLRLASPADRLGAALIDAAIIIFGSLALLIAILVAFDGSASMRNISGALALLVSFLFRVLYYPTLEFAWNGQTIGKRVLRIRVVDRNGGSLSPQSIIARNFLREIEFWLPLTSLMSLGGGASRSDGWISLLSTGWLLIICCVPLFTRDVMRLGDMVAGTWVIYSPKAELLPDLATAADPAAPAAAQGFRFTRDQVEPYGEFELEILAKVLRDGSPGAALLLPEVAARIQKKIGWTPAPGEPPRAFLLAYYKALRGHLESKLIFGKRKLDKYNID